jgi:hypothetical protein
MTLSPSCAASGLDRAADQAQGILDAGRIAGGSV